MKDPNLAWNRAWLDDNEHDEQTGSWVHRKIRRPLNTFWQRGVVEPLLRHALPPSQNGRCIPSLHQHGHPLPDERRGHHYISNSIRSARYNVWDFLPRQIWFQATRVNNLYFICVGVPQTIPGFSTTGNYTTILPLLFFMLLTVVKEGYDDWRRHRLDRVENALLATVLRGRGQVVSTSWLACAWEKLTFVRADSGIRDDADVVWTSMKWKHVNVGDVIRLHRDDAVPADIILLSTTDEDGVAYVETMALDGETTLKTKQAPPALHMCRDLATIQACDAFFTLEDPNRNLHDFNGRVTIDDQPSPLTLNHLLLRGSVLRNVDAVIGVVVNTGEETKIRMNANHHPKAKKPRLEHYSNQIVLALIVYVVLLSLGLSGGYLNWHLSTERHSWYLNNAYVPFKQIFIGYLIMFNNVIPLAMYVSLEIVKLGQMMILNSDANLYDTESNTPMRCNTNTILENLGQVDYILSDKTGTLTTNVLKFRKMTIAGVAWLHRPDVDSAGPIVSSPEIPRPGPGLVKETEGNKVDISVESCEVPSIARRSMSEDLSSETPSESVDGDLTTQDLLQHIRLHPSSAFSHQARDFILALALCHTALPDTHHDGIQEFQASSPDEIALLHAARDLGFLLVQRSSQTITLRETDEHNKQILHIYQILDVIEFSSIRKRMSIVVRCPDGTIWLLCKGADNVITSRLKQAALASRKSQEVRRSLHIEREAHRRSEQREVRNSIGARASLTIRTRASMDIKPEPRTSIMLDVRKPSHEIRVQTMSLEAPRPSLAFLQDPSTMEDATVFLRCFRQLDDFASEGLRTLVYAGRRLSETEYSEWKKQYTEATTSLTNRQERIEAAGEMIEQDFDLLGASAIEDKLQVGVPETIEKLRRANIRIWMLTGDKRETAINIAHSARICTPGSDVFILDAARGDIEGQLKTLALDLSTECLHSVAVIDGHTLAIIDESPALTRLLYTQIPLLDSVICCRASPAQKASLVQSIRTRIPEALTLAIGDGANDIAMIQAAHVGIGISGKEGLQAARVADYSIAQFRFLQRLLLVHGRWNYVRTAKFILWTFWKEMFFYMMQALYLHHNGYTGTSLYENWSLTALNTLFTSLCVILPGIFEQDLAATTLLAIPELYIHGQRNTSLHLPKALRWMLLATVQGMVVWFLAWAAFSVDRPGSDNGLFALGDLSFSLAIVFTNLKLLLGETHTKTYIILAGCVITVAGWWAWNAFLDACYSSNLSPYDVRHGFTGTFGRDPAWWATMALVLVVLGVGEVLGKLLFTVSFSSSAAASFSSFWSSFRRFFPSSPRRSRRRRDEDAKEADVRVWQELEKDEKVKEILRWRAGEDEEHSTLPRKWYEMSWMR